MSIKKNQCLSNVYKNRLKMTTLPAYPDFLIRVLWVFTNFQLNINTSIIFSFLISFFLIFLSCLCHLKKISSCLNWHSASDIFPPCLNYRATLCTICTRVSLLPPPFLAASFTLVEKNAANQVIQVTCTHTHTHTHRQTQRERESERVRGHVANFATPFLIH